MAIKRNGPYVPLSAYYMDDDRIMAAGEGGELLFLRVLAYCARVPRLEGYITDAQLQTRLGVKDATRRAKRLVDVGLLCREPEGYRVVNWTKWNRTQAEIDAERERDRGRKGKQPGNGPGKPPGNGLGKVLDSGTHISSSDTASHDTAAAAQDATPLPPLVNDLRTALGDVRLWVRWDKLSEQQVDEIAELAFTHGTGRLVNAAQTAYQTNNPPAYAQAWLGVWRQLPEPTRHLAAVKPRCAAHGLELVDSRCTECEQEAS